MSDRLLGYMEPRRFASRAGSREELEVIGDAESDAHGRICGVEAKEIRVLFKIEPNVIVLPLCKRGHVPCEVVPDADEGVQTEFRARLGGVSLGNRGILDAGNEDAGADTYVRLQSVSGIAKHQIEWSNCQHTEIGTLDSHRRECISERCAWSTARRGKSNRSVRPKRNILLLNVRGAVKDFGFEAEPASLA